MILKYTASRATEEQILALIPAGLRTEVTDALRADAWTDVIIRPEQITPTLPRARREGEKE